MLGRIPSAVAVFSLRFYQRCISPYLGNNCRFSPSCSQYGVEAFTKHGFFGGFLLTFARVARCGPWTPGGYDPVPETFSIFPKKYKRVSGEHELKSKQASEKQI